ncbi:DNA helicase [Clostridia bacterium]|nr:DNA helicase [Clostridia bacterium]
MKKFLENLNKPQQEAVLYTEGALLVLAGAGSGKTRVLTRRCACLLDKGVSPLNLLALTFTNKAAREMKERVADVCDGGDKIWVSTFHSMCVRILRREIEALGYTRDFTIYDSDDSTRIITTCMAELNINKDKFQPKGIAGEISRAKDENISVSEYETMNGSDFRLGNVAKVYKLYQKKLREANAVDFDDIISKTVELFKKNPDTLEKYQSRFKYIMVDEYQDTNTLQYNLIHMLAAKYGNICVVGDDDQSIYGWRGANIRNILEFEKDFKGAKVIKLTQNYRSTKIILDCANSVIQNNTERKSKELWTQNGGDEKITFYSGDTDFDEAYFIINEIKRLSSEKNMVFSDFAVLYRTHATSRVIAESCFKNNLPYRIFGGVNFSNYEEIKDISAYLKLINNPSDRLSFMRVINVPKRGIGLTTIGRVEEYANEHNLSMYDAAKQSHLINGMSKKNLSITAFTDLIDRFTEFSKTNSVNALVEKIITDIGYRDELKSINPDKYEQKSENLDVLVSKALEYDLHAQDSTLSEFLSEMSLGADIDNLNEEDNRVALMTLHNCKGLEFPVVFIAGFEDGILPGYRAVTSGSTKELEEERRLCYVGITRAREKLYLTAAKKRDQAGRELSNPPSRFLGEIDQTLLERQESEKRFRPRDKATTHVSPRLKADKPHLQKAYEMNAYDRKIPAPKDVTLEYAAGDTVSHMKYGKGEVLAIDPGGADYEVTIKFGDDFGIKKFMAGFAKLKKIET